MESGVTKRGIDRGTGKEKRSWVWKADVMGEEGRRSLTIAARENGLGVQLVDCDGEQNIAC